MAASDMQQTLGGLGHHGGSCAETWLADHQMPAEPVGVSGMVGQAHHRLGGRETSALGIQQLSEMLRPEP